MSSDAAALHLGNLAHPASVLARGNLYALIEEDVDFASDLIRATLLAAASDASATCLITNTRRLEAVVCRGRGAEQIDAALGAGQLTVLRCEPSEEDLADALGFGARLIEEVGHFGNAPKRLLVLDGAESWFDGPAEDHTAMLRQWRDWAEREDMSILMVCRRNARASHDPIATLLPLERCFAGLARVRAAYESTVWEVFHWFHPRGLVTGKSLLLLRDAAGALALDEHEVLDTVQAPAADDDAVIAVRAMLLPNESASPRWQIVDDMDRLPARTAHAVAATILLGFTPTIQFDRMARCVFDMRKQCGPRIKIVIREINTRMRQSQEALAIRLGANLIVPAGVTHARFLSLAAMVQGQRFPHILPASYEEALADATPKQARGYLSPLDFADMVASTMSRSQALRVENTLLRLPLAYGLTPIDALRYCNMKRDGDICSADAGSLFVFLYACREIDIDMTMSRLFRLPVAELFGREYRYLTAHDIKDAMHIFEGAAADMPDLSTEVAAFSSAAYAATAPALVLVEKAEKNGPAVLKHNAPPAAVKRPLPVRPGTTTPTMKLI